MVNSGAYQPKHIQLEALISKGVLIGRWAPNQIIAIGFPHPCTSGGTEN